MAVDELIETAELQAFARIVAARSLSRAADELRVPRATLGRRLARLEQRLATRLVRRTTRSLVLTDAGEAFYRHALVVLDAVGHAQASVRHTDDAVRGALRVSVPPVLTRGFRIMLADFASRYPAVRLEVDFTARVVDLLRGDADVALRASLGLQPGLVARTLAREDLIAVASPAYLAASGTPTTRRDLRTHRCLMSFARGEVPNAQWPIPTGGRFHVEGAMFSNDVVLLLETALRGGGIAVLPDRVANAFVARGELVHVLPGAVGGEVRISLVYPERALVPAPVRAFVDAVMAWSERGICEVSWEHDAPVAPVPMRRKAHRA